MESIIPTSEYTEVDGRLYSNPQVGLDARNQFIDKLRNTQAQQNQQIAKQTYDLGSALPSVQGGLGTNTPANMGYFTSRYQTPQTNSAVADLRAAAQATALNQVLENEQAIWKKRYQDAYRAYQKRQYDKTNPPTTPGDKYDGGVDYEDPGATTGLDAVQDVNQYGTTSTIYDSTEQAFDSRSTERDKQIEVIKDSNGNVSMLTVNGVPHYGREARARYRYLKNAGLVR